MTALAFAPRPENDFRDYIAVYYRECRGRFEQIEAIAGKWMYRDLLPAMSDFDTRFIVRDGLTADDWCAMSSAIGEAHLALCRQYPAWARNLEHLPGINLTWTELANAESYYPEFQQWSFYDTEQPKRLSRVLAGLAQRPWNATDELFHLKRFCQYFGRYNRTIDPPINLGPHVAKYPLHSRLMHYFCPPVLAAMCLLDRRTYAGKLQAFEQASRRFPELRCWEPVFEILHGHYETPTWYTEARLTLLEDMLEEALVELAGHVRETLTLVPLAAGVDMTAWLAALTQVPQAPAAMIFDSAKFARLMKGRLWFYSHAPAHFDTGWLIQNELRRIGYNFFQLPFRVYGQHCLAPPTTDPLRVLAQLRGTLLTSAEAEATEAFHRLTAQPTPAGQERSVALALVDLFDDFFRALSQISGAAQHAQGQLS